MRSSIGLPVGGPLQVVGAQPLRRAFRQGTPSALGLEARLLASAAQHRRFRHRQRGVRDVAVAAVCYSEQPPCAGTIGLDPHELAHAAPGFVEAARVAESADYVCESLVRGGRGGWQGEGPWGGGPERKEAWRGKS